MDFFDHQEKARKNSHVLVFYFILAVIGIILAVYALATGVLFFLGQKTSPGSVGALDLWQPELLLITSGLTGGSIFLASSYKSMQLMGGGRVVAHELGGRHVDVHTTDFHESRLLNIVEEMAIASGVPVPEVYVMDSEDSINAFAAGRSTSDAVIGVTRGCMKLLTRDELQGVIAHEFAHILNGDMRLNMRLIGLLFGILFLTLIGEMLLRSTWYARGSRSREGGGAVLAIFAGGIGLIIIGYVGMFFANLIKASISRQREYLADASAVQFTRNPDGIAGALKKIGALSEGSQIQHPMARDASHLFFGTALSGNAFATHPPLKDRIKRLLPNWGGDYGSVSLPPITAETDSSSAGQRENPNRPPVGVPGVPIPGMMLAGDQVAVQLSESEAAESMSSVHAEQIALSHDILEHMPEHWLEAAHSEPGAQAVIFALLLAQDERLRDQELQQLEQALDVYTYQHVVQLYGELAHLHSSVKLAMVDISIPALRRLSPAEYHRFRQVMEGLIVSDEMVDLFEFTLQKVVGRHLDTYFRVRKPTRIRYRRISDLQQETSVLVSTLAAFSNPDSQSDMEASFASAAAHLSEVDGGISVSLQGPESCGLVAIREAIEKFEAATPIVKKEFLLACSKAVLSDGIISSHEAELIRAIADAIGCSVPPFVRSAPLATA